MGDKIKSRKLWLTCILMNLIFLGPLLYKQQGISDQVTLWALGAIAALGTAYLGANVASKKKSGESDV